MSVTFSPATPESVAIAHNLTCVCGAWVFDVVYPDYASACRARYAGNIKSACDDEICVISSRGGVLFPVPAVEFPEVNLANGNACMILEVLGIDVADDLCGEVSADDFLGRILIALALSPVDEGMPAYKISGDDDEGATIWQAPRPVGYTQDVLNRLREVAEFAKSKGWGICWG